MGQWEPLPDRIPVDMRRLATQLRRMKDRSGLTVPALAARTAQPVESWERAFAARQLPPLDAVEVLAQASGADYDRTGALWKLAEKASNGGGDRGRGKPVPRPDPLDPLSPEEGLPGGRRRVWLLGGVAALAVAALVAVLLTAGISTGRAPGGAAGPTATGAAVPERSGGSGSPDPGARGRGGTPGRGPAGPGSGASLPGAAGDRPSPAMESASPGVARTGGAGSPSAGVASPTASASSPSSGGGGGGSATPTASASAPPPSSGTPSPAPSVTPTRRQLCLGLIVLGVCIG